MKFGSKCLVLKINWYLWDFPQILSHSPQVNFKSFKENNKPNKNENLDNLDSKRGRKLELLSSWDSCM